MGQAEKIGIHSQYRIMGRSKILRNVETRFNRAAKGVVDKDQIRSEYLREIKGLSKRKSSSGGLL